MMSLGEVGWITPEAREILAAHNCMTLPQLASLETADSMADVVPISNLRALARRARQSLGRDDPYKMIGQAAGARGPVVYAGGKSDG